jgi:hypothetical protein
MFHLRDEVRKNTLKNGEPTVSFSFMTMLQHTGNFLSIIYQQRIM